MYLDAYSTQVVIALRRDTNDFLRCCRFAVLKSKCPGLENRGICKADSWRPA